MPRYARALFTAILLSLIAFALPAVTSPATAEEEPDPMFGAPKAGRCYDVSNRAVNKKSIDADTVSCSKKHRLQIVGVFELPTDATFDWEDPVTSGAYDSTCPRAVLKTTKATKRNFARAPYGRLRYFPSLAQQEAGARWFVCALARMATPDKWMPRKGKVDLSQALRPNARVCMNAKFRYTSCSVVDTWKITATTTKTVLPDMAKSHALEFCIKKYGESARFGYGWRSIVPATGRKWVYGLHCFLN